MGPTISMTGGRFPAVSVFALQLSWRRIGYVSPSEEVRSRFFARLFRTNRKPVSAFTLASQNCLLTTCSGAIANVFLLSDVVKQAEDGFFLGLTVGVASLDEGR